MALFKISGPGYRFMSKLFSLPSHRTLSRLLSQIPIKTGINSLLMDNLKSAVKKFSYKDKFCIVMFDEMALSPHLDYDKGSDKLCGVNNGLIMDHVLVFMIRGYGSNQFALHFVEALRLLLVFVSY